MLTKNLVKVIRVGPYAADSVAEAIDMCNYYDESNAEIARLFAGEPIGLKRWTDIYLFNFTQELYRGSEVNQVLKNKVLGDRRYKPMRVRHLFGIGIQHPEEQECHRIIASGSIALGSLQEELILSAGGYSVIQHGPPDSQDIKPKRIFRALDLIELSSVYGAGCLFGAVHASSY